MCFNIFRFNSAFIRGSLMGGVSDWKPQADATGYQVIMDFTGYQVGSSGFYCKVEEIA